MYITLWRRPTVGPEGDPAPSRVPVGPNVVCLGVTSLLTDVSSEMVAAVLPLYLTFELRLTAVQFGAVDGMAQAVTALTLLAGAFIADRSRRYKEAAASGYAVSAVCKLGLLATAGSWLPTTGVLFLDRTAKGARTAPRDSLISLSAPPGRLGAAFGVHRAFDTAGAVLGPLLAFVLLWWTRDAYDAVFVVSFCFAVMGVGVIVLLVQNRSDTRPRDLGLPRLTVRDVAGLTRVPSFRKLLVAAAVLNVLTASDAFVYLTFQHRSSLQTRYFPLLFVGTAVSYLLLAVPFGRFADRLGAARVLAGGYVLLLGVYGILTVADPGPVALLAILGLLGAYYAATDGVFMALASSIVPAGMRASGIGLLATGVAMARFVSSILFGTLWGHIGPRATVVVYVAGLIVALPLAARLLRDCQSRSST